MPLLVALCLLLPSACRRGPQPETGQETPAEPSASTEAPPRRLTPGTAIERRFDAGEAVHGYALELAAGEALEIRIEQRGVDVVAEVRGPDGGLLAQVDSPFGRWWSEEAVAIAVRGGRHAVEVRRSDETAVSSPYRLSAERRSPVSDVDRHRAAAAARSERALELENEGRPAAARAAYQAAIDGWQRAADRRSEAVARYRLGVLLREEERPAGAGASFERALALQRELGEEYAAAWTSIHLIETRRKLGVPLRSEQLAEQARVTAEAFGDRRLEAKALSALASLADESGRAAAGADYFQKALAAAEVAGDRQVEYTATSGLGTIRLKAGDPEAALELFFSIESLAVDLGPDREASLRRQIGRAQRRLGGLDEALVSLERALDIERQRGRRVGEAETLNLLGLVRKQNEDLEGAEEQFRAALQVFEAERRPVQAAEVRINLGEVRQLAGRPAAARAMCRRVLESPVLEARPALEASTAYCIALAELKDGRAEEALEWAQRAIDVAETLRREQPLDEQRATYLSEARRYYELPVEVNVYLAEADPGRGYAEAALRAAEQGRARTLLDRLQQSLALGDVAISPEAEESKAALERRLEAIREQRRRAEDRDAGDELEALDREAVRIVEGLRMIETAALLAHPAAAELLAPSRPSLAEIRELLDADTQLLVYHLGERAAFAWVVDDESVSVHRLAASAELDDRSRKLHGWLADSHNGIPRRLAESAAAELAAELLAPLADRLRGPRLVILPDRALHYVPFGVLPLADGEPLVERFTVAYAPSIGVLRDLRKRRTARRADRVSAGEVRPSLVVADPVFSADDPRLAAGSAVVVAAAERGGCEDLDRLPYSAREASDVARRVLEPRLLTGFDAVVPAVEARLPGAGLVHFATHACIDPEFPELSGIALSRVDRRGRPVDGLLRVHEILDLDLEADLVVVSACRSALGREIPGEGLQGIARGLLYAGASQVVVSLWAVDDRATRELMGHFYSEMFDRGRSPAEALAAAQRSMAADPEWSAPSYWAPFVVQGDWSAKPAKPGGVLRSVR